MGVGVAGSAGGGGRRGRRKGRSASMHEINITPMVDVMLVLLIIFMVAAPMLTVGVPVKLPETAATALPTEQEEPLTITITADGALAVQSTPISDEELLPKLEAIAKERTSRKVFLRADGAISYERVAQVMGALNAGGFNEIGLVTDAEGPSFGAGETSNSETDG
jgi:biopolymer transport protein TolR